MRFGEHTSIVGPEGKTGWHTWTCLGTVCATWKIERFIFESEHTEIGENSGSVG